MNQTILKDLDLNLKICKECNEEIEAIVNWIDGSKRKVPIACKCIRDREQEAKEKEERLTRERKLDSLYKYSMMDNNKKKIRFDTSTVDNENKKYYILAKNYCDDWQMMKEEGIGFLYYGNTGVGKTHLTYCIANELIKKGALVIIISTINLISRIYESYGKHGEEGEATIINNLNSADLLILDDLGAEHSTEKSKQIIYSVLDCRTRSGQPTIVTTNLSNQQLKYKLTQEDQIQRTYERLLEMCQPIEFVGRSRRMDNAKRKQQIINERLLGGIND